MSKKYNIFQKAQLCCKTVLNIKKIPFSREKFSLLMLCKHYTIQKPICQIEPFCSYKNNCLAKMTKCQITKIYFIVLLKVQPQQIQVLCIVSSLP